jgi:hypothetical protein
VVLRGRSQQKPLGIIKADIGIDLEDPHETVHFLQFHLDISIGIREKWIGLKGGQFMRGAVRHFGDETSQLAGGLDEFLLLLLQQITIQDRPERYQHENEGNKSRHYHGSQ